MSQRGRPRKDQCLYKVKDWIEYTSDSDSDCYNVQRNAPYEVHQGSLSSIGTNYRLQHGDEQQDEGHHGDEQQDKGHHGDEQQDEGQQDEGQHGDEQQDEGHHGEVMDHENHHQQQQQHQQQQHHGEDFYHLDEGEVGEEAMQVQAEEKEDEDDEEGLHEQGDIQQPQLLHQAHEYQTDDEIGSEDDNPPDLENEDYDSILKTLKSDWLVIESNHNVSKVASDLFWRKAMIHFPKLKSAPGNKRTPQFKSIRRKMHEDLLPKISLEIGYKNRVTGEIEVVKDTCTPLKRFSPSRYEKLFEIGTIKVSNISQFYNNV